MIALSGTFRRPAHMILIAFLAAVALGFGTVAVAQEEDITDNEVCLECHADTDRSEPKEMVAAIGQLSRSSRESSKRHEVLGESGAFVGLVPRGC